MEGQTVSHSRNWVGLAYVTKELLVQKYHVAGSRGVELFFEPDTFRHVASRFRLHRVTLSEKFRDFAEFDGLQLPTSWTITLDIT